MSILLHHFWIVFMIMTVVQVRMSWTRVQPRIREHPELEPGYRRLFLGYFVFANLPWLVMGAGILSGRVPATFSYLFPRQGNPFVLAWWTVLALLVIAHVAWVLVGGGAEFLERHPGLPNFPDGPARRIRWVAVIGLAWSAAVACIPWFAFPAGPDEPPRFASADPWLLVVLFMGAWIAVMFGMSFVLSWTGGWADLAEKYPRSRSRPTRRFWFRSAKFGRTYYNGLLMLGVDEQGIHFGVLPPFRLGHRPFFVPWSDVRTGRGKTWIYSYVELRFAAVPSATVQLSVGLADEIFRAAGRTVSAGDEHGSRA